jgi:LysR family hydrogen peroxide-inducible transcriptional activator
MTLQQLEYIVALDQTRHFVKAAERCNVTQPTLSAMIRKLEEELGVVIFNRSSYPVLPTPAGLPVIERARVILFHARQLVEEVAAQKTSLSGSLSVALIPTVAPYLLPGFMSAFRRNYPDISLKVTEMRTSTILQELHNATIDMAILSTPLNDPGLLEVPLYYEKFIAYIAPSEPFYPLAEVSIHELPPENLWVLEEGHCLRNQVLNICENRTHTSVYEAGSIDTLVKIVDMNGGYTIIPELHINLLSEQQQKNLRKIVRPEATREISLVIRHDYIREGMMNTVADCIRQIIPAPMIDSRLKLFAIRL